MQRVLEDTLVEITKSLHAETGLDDLCFGGGVALNGVANGRILRESGFKNLYVPCAPGDAVRYAMLRSHYRDPLDWTPDRLAEAKHALDHFYLALRHSTTTPSATLPPQVQLALEDDLNTPLALSALHDLVGKVLPQLDAAIALI